MSMIYVQCLSNKYSLLIHNIKVQLVMKTFLSPKSPLFQSKQPQEVEENIVSRECGVRYIISPVKQWALLRGTMFIKHNSQETSV